MPTRLSCVIPAYNEAPRIGAVLRSVRGHPLIDEAVVVDDGSSDGTAEAAAAVGGARIIVLPRNRGKSAAVAEGVKAAQGDLLLLLDSDLLGLTPEHLTALIEPVLSGRAEASISLRRNAPALWRAIGLDYISGERTAPRRLLPSPEEMAALPRFGLEAATNARWIAARARIAVVRWPAVESPFKHAKRGWREGLRGDLGMMRDVFATAPPHRAAAQIWRMRRLAV